MGVYKLRRLYNTILADAATELEEVLGPEGCALTVSAIAGAEEGEWGVTDMGNEGWQHTAVKLTFSRELYSHRSGILFQMSSTMLFDSIFCASGLE